MTKNIAEQETAPQTPHYPADLRGSSLTCFCCGYETARIAARVKPTNIVNFWRDEVTTNTKNASSPPEQPWLSFSPGDMAGMRVKPAELARMFDVSKQTVSQWIKKGVITKGPDGLIDPRRAAKEVMHRADADRLRARIFRGAADAAAKLQRDNEDLLRRVAELEAKSAEDDSWIASLECITDRLLELFKEHAAALLACTTPDALHDLATELYFTATDECCASPGCSALEGMGGEEDESIDG